MKDYKQVHRVLHFNPAGIVLIVFSLRQFHRYFKHV
jgi:hypothetical protein